MRLSQVAPESRISTPASSFSQMRGTPNSTVGCTSTRLAGTVSIDSAKFTCVAAAALNHVLKMRSATWDSGRYDSSRSSGPGGGSVNAPSKTRILIAYSTFATVSIAPFGGPVVPEV